MNDMRLDPMRDQPPCQPEPVTPGFEGNGDARDGAPAPVCLVTPTVQHAQQFHFVRRNLLQGLSLNSRNGCSNEPTRLAQLDDRNQGGVLLEWDEGPAQIVGSSLLGVDGNGLMRAA